MVCYILSITTFNIVHFFFFFLNSLVIDEGICIFSILWTIYIFRNKILDMWKPQLCFNFSQSGSITKELSFRETCYSFLLNISICNVRSFWVLC